MLFEYWSRWKFFVLLSGGAGGKGVWGKLGSELEEDVIDINDPNYDSDSLDNGDIELKKIIPEVSEKELRSGAELIIKEYLEHGDTHEAILGFDELNLGTKRFMIVYIAIEIAMDHKPSHREMTSVLISDLYGRVVSQRDVAKGELINFQSLAVSCSWFRDFNLASKLIDVFSFFLHNETLFIIKFYQLVVNRSLCISTKS